jgi:hypothetical protein
MFFLLRHCTFDILPSIFFLSTFLFSAFFLSTLFRRFNEVRVPIFLYFDIFTFDVFTFDVFTFDQSRVNQSKVMNHQSCPNVEFPYNKT